MDQFLLEYGGTLHRRAIEIAWATAHAIQAYPKTVSRYGVTCGSRGFGTPERMRRGLAFDRRL